MLRRRPAQQEGAERRPAARSNGRRGLGGGQARRLGLAQLGRQRGEVDQRPAAGSAPARLLERAAVAIAKRGAQDLVAARHLAAGRLQGRDVERPAQAHRQRRCCRPPPPASSWSRTQSRSWAKESGSPPPSRGTGVDRRRGEPGRRGGAPRSMRAARPRPWAPRRGRAAAARRRTPRAPATPPGWRAASGRRARRSRRRAPTGLDAQHLAPDARPAPPRSASRGAAASRVSGRRLDPAPRAPAVHLAVRGERQGLQRDEGARGPCSAGSRPRRKARSAGRVARRVRRRHDDRRRAACRPRRPGAAPPPPARTAGCARQRGLDLAGSTRKPRSLTWWSRRPRNSTVPSGSQRARSPVR